MFENAHTHPCTQLNHMQEQTAGACLHELHPNCNRGVFSPGWTQPCWLTQWTSPVKLSYLMMGGEGNSNPYFGYKKQTSPVLLNTLTSLAAQLMKVVHIKKTEGGTHAIIPHCLNSNQENRANVMLLMQSDTQELLWTSQCNGQSAAAPSPLPLWLISPGPHTGIRRDMTTSTPKSSVSFPSYKCVGKEPNNTEG